MISALIRTLRLTLGGGQFSMNRELWLKSWSVKKRHPSHRRSKIQWGLDYRSCIKNHGLVWLSSDLVLWNVLPTLNSRALKHLAIARNAFQLTFRRQYGIQRILNEEDRFFELFRHFLQIVKSMPRESQEFINRRTRVLQLGADLVIKAYIQDILALLTTRFDCAERNAHSRFQRFTRSLTAEEALGLRGLTPIIIGRPTSYSPHFVLTRTPQSGAFYYCFPVFDLLLPWCTLCRPSRLKKLCRVCPVWCGLRSNHVRRGLEEIAGRT